MDRSIPRPSRRRFVQGVGVAGLGLLAGCGRLPWQAPPPTRVGRIAFLAAASAVSMESNVTAFRQGLADHGYAEGANLAIEWRFAEGDFQRMPALAAEVLPLQPEVIVVPSTADIRAVQDLTTTIPIVMAGLNGDLVKDGFAASLARPGGNITGVNYPGTTVEGKRLQLLTEALPGVSRVAVLDSPASGFANP